MGNEHFSLKWNGTNDDLFRANTETFLLGIKSFGINFETRIAEEYTWNTAKLYHHGKLC